MVFLRNCKILSGLCQFQCTSSSGAVSGSLHNPGFRKWCPSPCSGGQQTLRARAAVSPTCHQAQGLWVPGWCLGRATERLGVCKGQRLRPSAAARVKSERRDRSRGALGQEVRAGQAGVWQACTASPGGSTGRRRTSFLATLCSGSSPAEHLQEASGWRTDDRGSPAALSVTRSRSRPLLPASLQPKPEKTFTRAESPAGGTDEVLPDFAPCGGGSGGGARAPAAAAPTRAHTRAWRRGRPCADAALP